MTLTLLDALHDHYGHGVSKALQCQAQQAAYGLADIIGIEDPTLDSITGDNIKHLTRSWYTVGLSPATIIKRLNCLCKLGVNVQGHRPKKPNGLKWWLKPQQEAFLLAHPEVHQDIKDWIIWTTSTGLRIEETLRMTSMDIVWERDAELQYQPTAITVPGTKTSSSQATLPIGAAASAVVTRRLPYASNTSHIMRQAPGVYPIKPCPLFILTYEDLRAHWEHCMKLLKVDKGQDSTATLKALRRNAARYLHIDCGMPLDMVRQYLRHGDIKTTLGYLKLTGGYGTEEMKGYLR